MTVSVKDLYPQSSDYFSAYSYQPMIDSFGKVLIQVDDNDYQGDTRVLLEKANSIGLIIFGWGSCSGCDALQGCENMDDLQKLYDSMESSVKWFASAEQALCYFEDHDWEGDYSWHNKETRVFVSKSKDVLAKMVATAHDSGCELLEGSRKECTCENPPYNDQLDYINNCCDGDDPWEEFDRVITEVGAKALKEMQETPVASGDVEYNDQFDFIGNCGDDDDDLWEPNYIDGGSDDGPCPCDLCNSDAPRDAVHLRDELVVEHPLKTFVWEDVLGDYTPGIVVVVAKSLEDALVLVRAKSETAWKVVKGLKPEVVDSARVFVIHGGG